MEGLIKEDRIRLNYERNLPRRGKKLRDNRHEVSLREEKGCKGLWGRPERYITFSRSPKKYISSTAKKNSCSRERKRKEGTRVETYVRGTPPNIGKDIYIFL